MINYKPIGTIYTPFSRPEGTPVQSSACREIEGKVIINSEYTEGLKDLEGFSHIILIYHFHLSNKPSLIVKPFLDTEKHGVFATHASSRPNPIGLSVVKLIKIEKNTLTVKNIDIIDKTPLLDIKPYVHEFDLNPHQAEIKEVGWLKNNLHKLEYMKDDGRFAK
jgi:tRNA-Thr(GGU) m(6)t(6)A37 methyltransferase TsaA